MGEIRTVTTLRSKKAEIERAILGYETRIKQARADLAHVTAAIAIFEASGDPLDMQAYVDVHRLWKRGELIRVCKGFLQAEGPLNTRQLAERAMKALGFETADKVLAKTIAFKIVQAMRQQHIRGMVFDAGKFKGARVWTLTPPASQRGADSSQRSLLTDPD